MTTTDELLAKAIEDKHTIIFDYSDKPRIAIPKQLLTDQVMVLQIAGETSKGTLKKAAMKKFSISKMENIKVVPDYVAE